MDCLRFFALSGEMRFRLRDGGGVVAVNQHVRCASTIYSSSMLEWKWLRHAPLSDVHAVLCRIISRCDS